MDRITACLYCSKGFNEAQIRLNKRYCGSGCRGRAKRARQQEERFPGGHIPAGTKDRFGWLYDDGGEPDMIAVQLVVSGIRMPELTWTEAMLAGSKLVDLCNQRGNTKVVDDSGGIKGFSATQLICMRMNMTEKQAKNLMSCIRQNKARGRI